MVKKKKKNSGFVGFLSSAVSFFRDDRFRYAMGIVFLLAALFHAYLLYFLPDSIGKPTRILNGPGYFPRPEIQVENQGGKMGAWLSNLFINKWFGLASFLFPCHPDHLGHGALQDKDF